VGLATTYPSHFLHFCQATTPRGQNSSAQANIDEICHGLSHIFSEVNMIQAGEGTSSTDMQLIGPDTMLNNWETTPLSIRNESW